METKFEQWDLQYLAQLNYGNSFEQLAAAHIRACYAHIDQLEAEKAALLRLYKAWRFMYENIGEGAAEVLASENACLTLGLGKLLNLEG